MSTLFSHFFTKNNEIRPQEADFTEVLESIALKPKMLYFYGKMPENWLKPGCKRVTERPKTIAIVGTRKPTKYGENIAYKLAYEAARRGAVVVSGLAYGIDSVAHRAALDAGGVTVAVLGTPIDQIYPRPHRPLAAEIIEKGGCVLSELPPGAQIGDEYTVREQVEDGYLAEQLRNEHSVGRMGDECLVNQVRDGYLTGQYNDDLDMRAQEFRDGERLVRLKYYPKTCFLQRNRLISGLADVVVIPEAAERSGSLNTAAHALEQGKEIFAVPGDITRPLSQGCNRLIRQGATPMLGINDVLEVLFPPKHQKLTQATLIMGDTEAETMILRLIAAGLQDGEQIVQQSSLSVAEFNQTMTLLEIKNRVVALGANQWALR